MFKPKSNLQPTVLAIFAFVAICTGCQSNRCTPSNLGCGPCELVPNCGPAHLSEGNEPCIQDCGPIDSAMSPLAVADYTAIAYEDISLDQCIGMALQNSKVFRDLGGTIITTPQIIDGVYDPAIVFSDPQFSEEAALSAFDANFSTAAFFQNNDQASNLTFQGNNGIFEQDFHDYRASLQKLAATGTLFTLSNITNYDNSNQTGQTLPHSWQTIFQGEFRHPLLQGGGVEFNRIAGPSTQPGVLGGVLIARTNSEISLSQFREGVRDLVSEVENAYWDLYFSYRNLEATIEGRDKAYEILVETNAGKDREGSQAQAQAKEQYLRFERSVLDAMEGRPTFGTRNNNGMTGGVFLSNGGVRVTERRLRLICGLPINGPQLLKTMDEPASTGVQFDWDQSIHEAFHGRQELLQQRWLIKQRELQLVASKNFLKPRFDLIGQYRFRGTGRSLTGGSDSFQEDLANGTQVSSAFGDLASGDFQEWQVGAEFSMPLGFRAAHLGVRNAELALSRERAILQEQKREIVFGLSNAFGELRRTYATLKASEEQYVAAREFQYVMKLEVERGRDRDIELEAQRRVVEAEIEFRRSQIEYMLALKNIHFEKGTYLQFCNVRLSESASNPKAQSDASERAARRGRELSYVTDSPAIAQPKPVPVPHHIVAAPTIPQPQPLPAGEFDEIQFADPTSQKEPESNESEGSQNPFNSLGPEESTDPQNPFPPAQSQPQAPSSTDEVTSNSGTTNLPSYLFAPAANSRIAHPELIPVHTPPPVPVPERQPEPTPTLNSGYTPPLSQNIKTNNVEHVSSGFELPKGNEQASKIATSTRRTKRDKNGENNKSENRKVTFDQLQPLVPLKAAKKATRVEPSPNRSKSSRRVKN